MRKTISSAVPAELAERDSDTGDYTAAEEIRLENRAEQLLSHRLYRDQEYFSCLMHMSGSAAINGDLQHALRNLDAMITGDELSHTACMTAFKNIMIVLANIQTFLTLQARDAWTDELRQQAEGELSRGEL